MTRPTDAQIAARLTPDRAHAYLNRAIRDKDLYWVAYWSNEIKKRGWRRPFDLRRYS